MTRISVTDLARNLADFMSRVAYGGERFVVSRGKRDVATLQPVRRGRRLEELPSLLESLPRLGPDEADALACDLDDAREELGPTPEGEWGS